MRKLRTSDTFISFHVVTHYPSIYVLMREKALIIMYIVAQARPTCFSICLIHTCTYTYVRTYVYVIICTYVLLYFHPTEAIHTLHTYLTQFLYKGKFGVGYTYVRSYTHMQLIYQYVYIALQLVQISPFVNVLSLQNYPMYICTYVYPKPQSVMYFQLGCNKYSIHSDIR